MERLFLVNDGIWFFFWQWAISFSFFPQVSSEKRGFAGKYGHFTTVLLLTRLEWLI
jgi:hypothetical protein